MTRVRTNTPVKELMTANPVSLTTQMKVSEAAELLRENHFHHLPVTTNNILVGMFTKTDLISVDYSKALNQDPRAIMAHLDATTNIGELMTTELVTIDAQDTVRDAAKKLCDGHFHALPVVGQGNSLLGILTSSDLLRFLAEI